MRRHPRSRTEETDRSRRRRLLAAIFGAAAVAAVSYGATNWIVGIFGGSSGQGQSASVANLSISAVASPAANNLLYPGGTGAGHNSWAGPALGAREFVAAASANGSGLPFVLVMPEMQVSPTLACVK